MRSFFPQTRSIFIILLLAFFVAACSSSSTGPSGQNQQNQTINQEGVNADLGNETIFIDDQTTESAMTEADNENQTYTFDQQGLTDAGVELRQGEILLISKVALGRITSVSENNGEVKVETEFAALTEAFENADIEWDRSFEFTPDVLEKSVIEFRGKHFKPSMVSATKSEWEISSGPYTGKASIEANGNSAAITVGLKKEEGNTSVGFSAKTTIKQIANYTNIEIRDHETKSFEFIHPNMGGEVELKLAAAGGGVDQDIGIGPLAMLKIPFTIGPIPVVLAVNVRTVAKIDVQGNASAVAETKFSYSGRSGLKYDGTNVSTDFDNAIANPNHQGGSGDLAALIGVNVNAQWGFTAPELELQMFGNTLVPYLRPEFYLRANLTWGPVCQKVSAEYKVAAGLSFRFLGVFENKLAEEDIVPMKKWEAFSPQDCANKIVDGHNKLLFLPPSIK
ncbi:MAG: hypothetical protein GVY07_05190 [Bacteroidetes bacterium]|jgi:uncharacterized protein YcfL|nr:hypothetical protein [Bacteroidota bacterium]